MSEISKKRKILGWALLAALFLIFLSLVNSVQTGSSNGKRARTFAEITAVRIAIRACIAEYGNDGVLRGDHVRLLTILRGENPRKIIFFDIGNRSINPRGELIDPWGTPYLFDLTDPENPRVWSCGKDRRDDGGAEGSDDITSWR